MNKLILPFSTLMFAACSTDENAQCRWELKDSATGQLHYTDSERGEKFKSEESCKAEAELRSRRYCSKAGLLGITASVSYTWVGPKKFLGEEPLVAGPLTSFECK